MSNEFGVLIDPKHNVIVADSQDINHAQSVNPNLYQHVPFAASVPDDSTAPHTVNASTVRRSETKNAPHFLLETPVRFHPFRATPQRTPAHAEITDDLTPVTFEQARAVAEELGCDWTRLEDVIACFVHARLLVSRERHELYQHTKPSKSE